MGTEFRNFVAITRTWADLVTSLRSWGGAAADQAAASGVHEQASACSCATGRAFESRPGHHFFCVYIVTSSQTAQPSIPAPRPAAASARVRGPTRCRLPRSRTRRGRRGPDLSVGERDVIRLVVQATKQNQFYLPLPLPVISLKLARAKTISWRLLSSTR